MYRQIDLDVNEKNLEKCVRQAKERYIRIPTFRQMKDPAKDTPEAVKEGLKKTGLWDVNPLTSSASPGRTPPKAQEASMGR